MTPVQSAGLVDYRNRVESFQPKQLEMHELVPFPVVIITPV